MTDPDVPARIAAAHEAAQAAIRDLTTGQDWRARDVLAAVAQAEADCALALALNRIADALEALKENA